MKINEIYIDKFGKLKDFRIDFKDGYNLIYGDNESGKTTIFTFIKMMFYGTSVTEDAKNGPREKYKPWDGGQMSGSIDFEFNNEQFMLERKFGATNKHDKIVLINLTTGEEERFETTINIGFMFFGIDADGFENSIFIGQPDSNKTKVKYDETHIQQRISNLITTGTENISAGEVLSRLENARNAVSAKNDKFGLIDDKKLLLEQLAEELAEAKEDELAKLKQQKECDVLLQKKKKYQSEYARIKLALINQERLAQIKSMEAESSKHATIAKLRRDLAKKEARLSVSALNVDDAYINTCREKYNQLQEAEKKRNSFNSALKRIGDEIKAITSSNDSENAARFLEVSDFMNENEAKLLEMKSEYNEKKAEYDRIDEEIKAVDIECQIASQKSEAMEDVLRHRLFAAEESLRLARETKVISTSRQSDNYTYVIGGFIIVFSVILTAWGFKNYAVYAFAIIGILCGLFMLLRQHRKGKEIRYESVDEVAVAKANENLLKVRNEIEREKFFTGKAVTDARTRMKELNEIFLPLSKETMTLRNSINDLELRCSNAQKQKIDIEISLAKENSRFNVLKQDNQNVLDQLKKLSLIINNLDEEFIELVSKYKKVDTRKNAVNIFENLVVLTAEIKSLREKLNSYNANGGPVASKTIAEKIQQINDEILKSNNGNMPELLKPEQLAVLKNSVEESNERAHAASEEYVKLCADVKIKFIYSKSIAVLERKIAEVNEEIAELQGYCKCIDESIEALNESVADMQVRFPSLSTRAEELFRKMTGGSKKELSIYDTLNHKVSKGKSNAKNKAISVTTYNQAYLALRLAIAERISRVEAPLPLFMDDIFMHYDDTRAALGISMLNECAKNTQVLMLTCHKHFIEIAQSNDCKINVIEI